MPKLSVRLRIRIITPRGCNHARSSLFGTCAFGTILARINRVSLDVEARPKRLRASVGESPEKVRTDEKDPRAMIRGPRVLSRLTTTSSVCPRTEWLIIFKYLINNESLFPVITITGNSGSLLGKT